MSIACPQLTCPPYGVANTDGNGVPTPPVKGESVNRAYTRDCGIRYDNDPNDYCGYFYTVEAASSFSISAGTVSGGTGVTFNLGTCPSGEGFYIVCGSSTHPDRGDWGLESNTASGTARQFSGKSAWLQVTRGPDAGHWLSAYDWSYLPNGDIGRSYTDSITGQHWVSRGPILSLHDSYLSGTMVGGSILNLVNKDTHGDVTGRVWFSPAFSHIVAGAFTGEVQLLRMRPFYNVWLKNLHPSRKLTTVRFNRNNGGLLYDLEVSGGLGYTGECNPFIPNPVQLFFPFGGVIGTPYLLSDDALKVFGIFDDGYEEQVVFGKTVPSVLMSGWAREEIEMFASQSLALRFGP